MNLPEQIRQAIAARKLLRPRERVLVAVSGGVDSMVLLHALAAESKWSLHVAHFNHQLRGQSSDADERFVRDQAKRLGLKFIAGRGDVRALGAREGLSIEMAARELRHAFLAQAARRLKAGKVLLAHHADDQVELFFLRLLRGSGAEGLSGMKYNSPSPADSRIRLVRPMLGIRRAALEAFAREQGIKFRVDTSNKSRDFLRNRIRLELLPLLRREYARGLDATVLRSMDLIGAEAEAITGLVKQKPGKGFGKQPIAIQRRQLQAQLQQSGITTSFELVEWLRNNPGKLVSVDQHQTVSADAHGKLSVTRTRQHRFDAKKTSVNLMRQHTTHFSGAKFQWKIEQPGRFVRPKAVTGREFFDAVKVGGQIILRHWRAGDRFQPIGMANPVKLQDLFVNAKIPRERRMRLIVATTRRGELFWVEGLRIGERFKLTPTTRRRLRWGWQSSQF